MMVSAPKDTSEMISKFPEKGILAALHLPFDSAGKLNKTSLRTHVDWLKSRGVHGFLALGSSGNFPFLSVAQRIEVLNFVRSIADPLPVIANISDLSPENVRILAKESQDLGLAGIALMPPFFYPSSDEDQLAYFLKIADTVPEMPILLYNFPELTGNRIALNTISEVAKSGLLKGFKQSGAEFNYHHQLIALGNSAGFSVFSGADTRLPEVFSMGASGCIGGFVNVVPELMLAQFMEAFENTEDSCASQTEERLNTVLKILSKLPFPLNIAAAVEARGFDPGTPFSIQSSHSKQAHRWIVNTLREKFHQWELPVY